MLGGILEFSTIHSWHASCSLKKYTSSYIQTRTKPYFIYHFIYSIIDVNLILFLSSIVCLQFSSYHFFLSFCFFSPIVAAIAIHISFHLTSRSSHVLSILLYFLVLSPVFPEYSYIFLEFESSSVLYCVLFLIQKRNVCFWLMPMGFFILPTNHREIVN